MHLVIEILQGEVMKLEMSDAGSVDRTGLFL